MLDVLQFIFQDFWHWLGTAILLYCVFPIVSIKHIYDGDKDGGQL